MQPHLLAPNDVNKSSANGSKTGAEVADKLLGRQAGRGVQEPSVRPPIVREQGLYVVNVPMSPSLPDE